ncbi:MAG: hypothetical protein AAFY42_06900 [Pseudomonadota bacterium]
MIRSTLATAACIILIASPNALAQPPEGVAFEELSQPAREAVLLCAATIGQTLPAICLEVIRQDVEGPVLSLSLDQSLDDQCAAVFPNPSTPQNIACDMRAFAMKALAEIEANKTLDGGK